MDLAEASKHLGGVGNGNPEAQLKGFKPLHVAGESDLSFLHLGKYRHDALNSNAGAIIVNQGVELANHTLIVVTDATEAYRMAIDLFYPEALLHLAFLLTRFWRNRPNWELMLRSGLEQSSERT